MKTVLTIIARCFLFCLALSGCASNSYKVKAPLYGIVNFNPDSIKKSVRSANDVKVYYETAPEGFTLNQQSNLHIQEGYQHILLRKIQVTTDGIEDGWWRKPAGLLFKVSIIGYPIGSGITNPANGEEAVDVERMKVLRLMQQKAYEVGANAVVFSNVTTSEENKVQTLEGIGYAVVVQPRQASVSQVTPTQSQITTSSDNFNQFSDL